VLAVGLYRLSAQRPQQLRTAGEDCKGSRDVSIANEGMNEDGGNKKNSDGKREKRSSWVW
jgi:hypothetical protein